MWLRLIFQCYSPCASKDFGRVHSDVSVYKLRLESRSFIKLFLAGPNGCEMSRLPHFIDKELAGCYRELSYW
jgi:hypothetical protein